MAKRGRKGQTASREEEAGRALEGTGEAGGFAEEARRGKKAEERPRHYPGRTIGDTATSYSSVGGAEEPEEWPEGAPGPEQPGTETGPVHDVSFRPAPGGYIETRGQRGRNVPFTGEVVSTRDSTFEEDPDTGRTAAEEEGEFIKESLEERTRGYESG